MYLEILFCATFSLCTAVISSHGLIVAEQPSMLTNNELLFDVVENMSESTKTTDENALSLTNHNETNTQEETAGVKFMKLLDKTTLTKDAFSNKTADFQSTGVPIQFNEQRVEIADKDHNFLSATGLVPVTINEELSDNQILFADETNTRSLENQTRIYATNPNFVEKPDFLMSIVEPQPEVSEEISMETAELPPIRGPTEKENIETPNAEKDVETYGLPNAAATKQVTAKGMNLDTTSVMGNNTLGGVIEASGQGYEKPAKNAIDLPELHDSLEQNRTENQETQVYNITDFDLRAVFNADSDFEENSTPSTTALNATTTQTVPTLSKTASSSVAVVGNAKIKPTLLKNFATGTGMERPMQIPNRPKQIQAPSAWNTNLIAFHPTYLLNPFNYFRNSTNQNIFGFGAPASSWNFTNLFNTPFLADSSSSARQDRGIFRRSNATKLHFFPLFRVFNNTTRFNRTKFASNMSIKSAVNTNDLPSGLFPPTYATSKYLQDSEGRRAAGSSAHAKDTTSLRYSNEPSFYHSAANQLHTPVMYIGGPPQNYQAATFNNKHLQHFRKSSYLEQRTPINHSDHPYNKGRPCNSNHQKSVHVTVSEEQQSLHRGGQTDEAIKSVNDTSKSTTTSLKVKIHIDEPNPILKLINFIYNIFVPTNEVLAH